MKYLYYIMTILLFISCEREFDIIDPNAGPKLYIESLFYDQQDTVAFTVIATRPTTEGPQEYKVPSGMKVTVLENGQPREVFKQEDKEPSDPVYYYYEQPEYRWYLKGGFQPGSKVEILAQADGYPDAYSVVHMPEKFNDFTCRVEKYSDGRALHIDYQDDPATNDYYAVTVSRYSKIVRFDGTIEGETNYGIINYPVSDDFGEYDYPYMYMSHKGWDNWRSIVFWNDSRESINGRQTFTILISEKEGPDSWEWSDSFGGGDEVVGTVYASDHVYVYKLTSDTYHYLNGQWNYDYNDMASFGLAPPTYAFTNIRGGIGIFAGMSISEPYKIDWTYLNGQAL